MDIFIPVLMTGFLAYTIFIQKEDDDFVGDKPGMIGKTIVFVVFMALMVLGSLFISAVVPKEYQTPVKMETADWLLFIIVGLLAYILRELYTLRTMAQAWAKVVWDAAERGDIHPEAEWRR
jgi:phosphatidylserine synthase